MDQINRKTANKTYREKHRIPGNINAGLQNNKYQRKKENTYKGRFTHRQINNLQNLQGRNTANREL